MNCQECTQHPMTTCSCCKRRDYGQSNWNLSAVPSY